MEDDKTPEIAKHSLVTKTSSAKQWDMRSTPSEGANTEQPDNAVEPNSSTGGDLGEEQSANGPKLSSLFDVEKFDNRAKLSIAADASSVDQSDIGIKSNPMTDASNAEQSDSEVKPSPSTKSAAKVEQLEASNIATGASSAGPSNIRAKLEQVALEEPTNNGSSSVSGVSRIEQRDIGAEPNSDHHAPNTEQPTIAASFGEQPNSGSQPSSAIDALNIEQLNSGVKPTSVTKVEKQNNGTKAGPTIDISNVPKPSLANVAAHAEQPDTEAKLSPETSHPEPDNDANLNIATVTSYPTQPDNGAKPSAEATEVSNAEQMGVGDKPRKPERKKHSKNKSKTKPIECGNVPSVQGNDSTSERRNSSSDIDPIQSTNSECLSISSSQKSAADKPNELKLKINRLKDKLEKFSIKCAEADSKKETSKREYISPMKRFPQLRISSEGTSQRDLGEKEESTLSTSLSLASANIANNNVSGGSSDTSSRPKKARKRGAGKKSSNKSISEPFYADESAELILNAETFLLLDLLFMPAENREDFIVHLARKKQILVMDKDSLRVNPKIVLFSGILPYRDLANYFGKKLEDKCFGINVAAIERQPKTFEDFVNNVVHQDLPEETQKQFTFPVTPKKQRQSNYYRQKDFEDRMEAFAQKCVDANLGIIIEEKVRISAKNNEHAYIKSVDGERDAMFASQLLRKCAMHGDVVRAFVRNASQQQQPSTSQNADESLIAEDESAAQSGKSNKAFVIKTVQEADNRKVVGKFLSHRKDTKYITFVPRDLKVSNIRIYETHWLESFKTEGMANLPGMLYLVEIINWQDEICIGKILHPIGKCGELDSENRAILIQNNLISEPYAAKFNEMYEGEFEIPAEELKKREDIRTECVFTIDPLTARDLDDAMSCKQLHDGTFEIGVHISDVSYYLDEESELDRIVKTRTTSVYMVNEVFHMLPKPLCFRCSLLPAEDKLTFSVFWIMSAAGEILATRFARTVIRSCTQFAYQHAQMIIDNLDKEFGEMDFPKIHDGFTPNHIVQCVKQLNTLATILRNKRFDNGAIKIDRPKIYFNLDPDTGEPISFKTREQLTANFLIEEFMLLANQSVADFIYKKFPTISILRNHLPPLKNVVKKVKEQMQKIGMILDVSSSKAIYDSLQRLVGQSANPESMSVCLSQLISKPMIRARYICSEGVEFEKFWHYALSIPIYTHFTSPIRRYPDILVHRVLGAALGYNAPPTRSPSELHTLAESCNDGKHNAKLADEDSINLYFFYYIKSKKSLTLRAVITEITSYSVEAVLIDTGHQISVNFKELKNVQIEVTKDNGICSAIILFQSQPAKPIQLKMCDDVWLEVTAEKKRLRGQIVSDPRQSSDAATTETITSHPNEEITVKSD